jgi:hypothetical protein
MIAVVQASCPGCKNVLRIPAEWVYQPIRCKQCGLVSHAKQPAPIPLPVPQSRQLVAPTVPQAAVATLVTAPPNGVKAPAAIPLATPVRTGDNGSSFGFDDLNSPDDTTSARPRRRRGTLWTGPVVLLGVLLIAGGVLAANWSRVSPLLFPDDTRQAAKNPEPEVKEKEPVKKPEQQPEKPNDTSKKPDDPPKKPDDPTKKPDDPVKKPEDPPRPVGAFPRRALIISVHNYLYANPIQAGGFDTSLVKAPHIKRLKDQLGNALRIPLTQIAHLSDEAARDQARPPLKPVIENTLTRFLDTSRAQDRILVIFIGHSVEIGDDVYLAPLEGELDRAETLIPLKWIFDQLRACKARQKVLVLDMNRFNPVHGQERPGSGPMGPKLDAALKEPPVGVQVLSACSPEQRSYETENHPPGLFVHELGRNLQGKTQMPEEPYPLELLRDAVNKGMKEELDPLKLVQVSRLTGAEAADGAAYDPKEAAPPAPALAAAPAVGGNPETIRKQIDAILAEVGAPPVKASHEDAGIRYDLLPPFAEATMKNYVDVPAASDLRKAIRNARAALWAVSVASPPGDLAENVKAVQKDVKVNLSVLKDGYRYSANEAQLKAQILKDEKDVARILYKLEETQKELEEMAEERDKEPKRWQANYDFVLARVKAELAYLIEYQSLLGQMRKEFPPRDPSVHGGWKLASSPTMQGESSGKKLAKSARETLDKIIKEHPGTPWEVLAKREKLTSLGLEWQAAK